MEKLKEKLSDVRVDKWLWAVRLFKTRSQSAEACRKGKVVINEVAVKPSRLLKEGDLIHIRKPPSVFYYRVKALVEKRQPAKSVVKYLEDLTPDEERDKSLHKNLVFFARRDRGAGRPTKRERRIIDRFSNSDQL